MSDDKKFNIFDPFKSIITNYLGTALNMLNKFETTTLCKHLAQVQQQFERFMNDFKVKSFYCYKEDGKTVCEYEIEAPLTSHIDKKTKLIRIETTGSLIMKCEKT